MPGYNLMIPKEITTAAKIARENASVLADRVANRLHGTATMSKEFAQILEYQSECKRLQARWGGVTPEQIHKTRLVKFVEQLGTPEPGDEFGVQPWESKAGQQFVVKSSQLGQGPCKGWLPGDSTRREIIGYAISEKAGLPFVPPTGHVKMPPRVVPGPRNCSYRLISAWILTSMTLSSHTKSNWRHTIVW